MNETLVSLMHDYTNFCLPKSVCHSNERFMYNILIKTKQKIFLRSDSTHDTISPMHESTNLFIFCLRKYSYNLFANRLSQIYFLLIGDINNL